MLREEIKSLGKVGRKELRAFGLTVGVVLLLIAAWLLWKARPSSVYFAAVGATLAGLGVVLPVALKPLYRVWMTFAVVMGFVMTRVILTVIYFGLFTPVALTLKLLGKDLLEERWNKTAASYWVKRQQVPFDPADAERMF